MQIGVLGTGMVGTSIATRLVELGHDVMMGSRIANNEKATEWVAAAGSPASQGTFANAAAHGELVFNCTAGAGSLEALGMAGAENLAGKTLVDVANPLDFSQGMPPSLVVSNDDNAKAEVAEVLRSFGWPAASIHDLGDLSAARGMEAYLLLWLRFWGAFGTGHLNIRVVR